jgi:hypothetical protein
VKFFLSHGAEYQRQRGKRKGSYYRKIHLIEFIPHEFQTIPDLKKAGLIHENTGVSSYYHIPLKTLCGHRTWSTYTYAGHLPYGACPDLLAAPYKYRLNATIVDSIEPDLFKANLCSICNKSYLRKTSSASIPITVLKKRVKESFNAS